MPQPTLLTVEDDPIVRRAIVSYMIKKGYHVYEAEDGQDGIDVFKKKRPDIVLTDLALPVVNGLAFLSFVKKEAPDTPVIIVSGMGTLDDAIKALQLGAWDYITKPINDMALLGHAVSRALERVALEEENKRYQHSLVEEVEKRTAELQQSQKLEAVGTLAGGIAHDFNNILSAIMGYTDLAILDKKYDADHEKKLQMIKKASVRARDLVQQILTFSRRADSIRTPIQIYPTVKEALKLLRASIPTTVEIKHDIAAGPEAIKANPTEIHQIVMNLCTNSLHSMPKETGVLEVTLTPISVSGKLAETVPDLEPGDFLKLTVRDNGCGIDSTVVDQIFDPFFTTKEPGQGTGMGLSVVHGIVHDCGGAIDVSSEPGKGTTFDLYFPVLEKVLAEQARGMVVNLPKGTETVIFVDDEPELAGLGEKLLAYLGYKVVSFTSGGAALEAFRSNPKGFDLVITDQTMPEIPGSELGKEMMKIRPDLPVILCTGHSSIITPEKAKQLGFRDFLMKPLSIHSLANKVRKALDN
ncbi:MAG: response regulator [Desulfobulbaceae bacterium]|uniref:histidine kinase n=1 Tax=Candidatus Desulfobia pelagia TaxID=2841692 RepID=A0A8J6TAC6_9BACT|nr:response regulator [Candidatus Desulfobia pelagia]